MPPDKWLYRDIEGVETHSPWLRSGLAESLLLIAERGRHARLESCPDPTSFANNVVAGLEGLDSNWRLLASIRDQYPRIIEAAPSPLLDSLELLLEAHRDDATFLFTEDDSIFGATPMHTGLLWGLEILAWNAKLLPRVSLLLAKLAAIDPGGRWANRPINSLFEIFHWWKPSTHADRASCVASLDLIRSIEPKVGWQLLSKLCPSRYSQIVGHTQRPRWSDFGDPSPDWRQPKARQEYLRSIVDRVIQDAGAHIERWRTIFEALGSISTDQQEDALRSLELVTANLTDAPTKFSFWEAIRDFTNEHRLYQGAEWAVDPNVIERLARLLDDLAPVNYAERHAWLFEDWLPDLPPATDDIDERKARADRARAAAIVEVFTSSGVQGLGSRLIRSTIR